MRSTGTSHRRRSIYAALLDDTTRHRDDYILKYKSEPLEKFKEWKAVREKETGKQVNRFRTDGGGEYTSKKFAE
jgi:hypothetical protein